METVYDAYISRGVNSERRSQGCFEETRRDSAAVPPSPPARCIASVLRYEQGKHTRTVFLFFVCFIFTTYYRILTSERNLPRTRYRKTASSSQSRSPFSVCNSGGTPFHTRDSILKRSMNTRHARSARRDSRSDEFRVHVFFDRKSYHASFQAFETLKCPCFIVLNIKKLTRLTSKFNIRSSTRISESVYHVIEQATFRG